MGVAPADVLPDEVVDALRLDDPEAKPIVGGRVSKVWRARRGGVHVAVRQSPWFRLDDEVRYELDVLRRISAIGGPVARPLADTVVAGTVWAAFSWIPGSHPQRPVPDPARYGRLLAELHEVTAEACASFHQRPRWGRVDEFLTLPRAGGDRTLEDVLPEFEKSTGAVGTRMRRVADEVRERLAAAEVAQFAAVVAHGDFGPHQVLMEGDSVAGVVDWDFCHVDLRLADLAIATSLARPTPERAAAMLRGYFSVSEADLGDLEVMGDLRRAFHLNNLANQVCALWLHGIDISVPLAVIAERLDREQWWDPLLREAVQQIEGRRVSVPSFRHRDASDDLAVAHELADRAAIVAMHYFTRGVVTDLKDDASPVTEADHAAEHLLREGLGEIRPGDAIVGEEFGEAGSGSRVWILDPIDGTSSFARRDTDWRIQIALEEDGEIVVAVVDAPALGARWWATRGGGAFEASYGDGSLRTRPLRVSDTSDVEGAVVACYPSAIASRLPSNTVRPPRKGLALIDVVRGAVDAFFVDCCQIWDHAPWVLLVSEAGGAFTDHEGGRSPAKRGGLYSNAAVHDALLEAIVAAAKDQ